MAIRHGLVSLAELDHLATTISSSFPYLPRIVMVTMAIEDTGLSVHDLKRVKNRVIGNPKAKEALVRDEAFMSRLVLSCSFGSGRWYRRRGRGRDGVEIDSFLLG